MCDFNNREGYQPQAGRRAPAGKSFRQLRALLSPRPRPSILPSISVPPSHCLGVGASDVKRRRSACGRKTASFGKRCVGSLMLPLKVSFQVWFKEGGFAGRKQCCSEGTNLLDAGTSEKCAQRSQEVLDLSSQLGSWNNICPVSLSRLLVK